MHLLVTFLCVGVTLASAAPSITSGVEDRSMNNDVTENNGNLDEENKSKIESDLRQRLNEVLSIIVDAVQSGRELKGEFFTKLNNAYEKIKDMKKILGKAELDILDRIKEYFRQYLKNILQKYFRLSKRQAQGEKKTFDEVKKELKKLLDNFMEKVKDVVDSGKNIKDGFLQKIKEIREKNKMNQKRSLYTSNIDDNIDSELDVERAEENPTNIAEMKESFYDMLKRVKDAYENGKSIVEGLDKLEKIRKTLKDLNIDIGDSGREYLDKFVDKVKGYWQKLKDSLMSKRSADIDVFGMFEELKKELLDQLREVLNEKGEQRKQKILDFIERILDNKDE